MTRQHKQSLERVMEVSFKHRGVATAMATAVLAIEALTLSGIDTNEVVVNTDRKVVGRSVAALCHKNFGKRMADAVSTIDAIIAEEGYTVTAEDKVYVGAPHKQGINKVVVDEITRRIEGRKVASIVDKVSKVIDELLVTYGVGGAKEDAPTEAALTAIKALL